MADKITFSFGENWRDYLTTVSEDEINSAGTEIDKWLSSKSLRGKSLIDIGSGSGIHSLAFHKFGVSQLRSVDVDPHSVTATTSMWERAGSPDNWKVEHGSILDADFVKSLGQYDVVYSWGVLHHTGSMWEAIDNALRLVKPGGRVWIAIYVHGPNFGRDLELKKKYNTSSDSGKKWMLRKWIFRDMLRLAKARKNPFIWFSDKSKRGMNRYHDAIDWLGGLPYEVASAQEITEFCLKRDFIMEGIEVAPEGGCSDYVLRHVPGLSQTIDDSSDLALNASS